MRDEWQRTLRTALQVTVALIPAMPVLIPAIGLSASVGLGASILAVSASLARVMAVPVVNQALHQILRTPKSE